MKYLHLNHSLSKAFSAKFYPFNITIFSTNMGMLFEENLIHLIQGHDKL